MLQFIDWLIIVFFILLILVLGISYTRQSGKNMESFFLGGRNLPWWLAGLSMVATTFAADTPLAVTEIVGRQGIAGNWLWWNFLAGGLLTTFFFARLWQRSGVLTEVELIELRYSGASARFLRGFKAIYLGFFMNILIIGWVNVAMSTLLQVFFEISPNEAFWWIALLLFLVALYSSLAGLMGVAVTDAVQFVIAMMGCILLAIFVVNSSDIGGISGLKIQVEKLDPAALNFLPQIGEGDNWGHSLGLNLSAFISYIGILWWAAWYPGAEPGGGGYIAQRMMSTRSEGDAFKAGLFFQIAHYCIRPWPWILVGLCAMVLYSVPRHVGDAHLKSQILEIKAEGGWQDDIFTKSESELRRLSKSDKNIARILPLLQEVNRNLAEKAQDDRYLRQALAYAESPRQGFVFAMRDYLPAGILGMLLVAFFAAYMSTISTQLNWGAGYLVNDLYRRFWRPDESEKHYVGASRWATLLLAFSGLVLSSFITRISGAWEFILQCGAGLGLVLILRWYWWRINAWSELTAMLVPVLISIPFFVFSTPFEQSLPITVLFTTIAWLLVTIFSPATDEAQLRRFYERVQPGGDWSGLGIKSSHKETLRLLVQWLLAIVFTYSILFFVGHLLLGQWTYVGVLLVVILLSTWGLRFSEKTNP